MDGTFKPGDKHPNGMVLGKDMVWHWPDDEPLGALTEEERQRIERGDPVPVWPIIAVVLVVAALIIGLWQVWDLHPVDGDTPTPVVTETITTSPSPTFTKAPDGYATAYNIIEGVWQGERTPVERRLICKAWDILPHSDVLDQLETGLKGANEKIGVTDRQYREAATDFLDKECA